MDSGFWGALVCLNRTILSARDATKLHRTAVQAFDGLDGPVRYVDSDRVAFYRQPPRRRMLSANIEPSVALVKAHPAAGWEVIDAVVPVGARGIVAEGSPGTNGGNVRNAGGSSGDGSIKRVLLSRSRTPHSRPVSVARVLELLIGAFR